MCVIGPFGSMGIYVVHNIVQIFGHITITNDNVRHENANASTKPTLNAHLPLQPARKHKPHFGLVPCTHAVYVRENSMGLSCDGFSTSKYCFTLSSVCKASTHNP